MDLLTSLLLLLAGFIILIKSAEYAVKALVHIAAFFGLSQFTISFLIVGIASVLPEFSIAVNSALSGDSSFGLGVLLGSNVADLSIVIGLVTIYAGNIKVHSKIITGNFYYYLILIILPVLLLLDGSLSRFDGIVLILAFLFYIHVIMQQRRSFSKAVEGINKSKWKFAKNIAIGAAAIWALFLAAEIVANNSISISGALGVPALFIGIIIALGTCLPELTFSIEAVRERKQELGMGDILGNVATDATLSIGVVALIMPIEPPQMAIALLSGFSMIVFGILTVHFLRTEKHLVRKEGYLFVLLYLIFMAAQFALESSILYLG
ncbi:MAG TPA: sodium:calcium antiporter [Candidatus Norongarragalinales archaeon]|nr:sodium:calcium antiporter [Candidatus Norongarragalinales archaeon]